MAHRLLRSQHGIALILVISIIAALVTAGVMLNRQVRGMLDSSVMAADTIRSSEMCRSGIEAAVLRLDAAKPEEILGWIFSGDDRDELNEVINRTVSFSYGNIEVDIADERARIQVNAIVDYPARRQFNSLQQQLWERFLKYLKTASPDAPEISEVEIVNALKDWLDTGDDDAVTGLSGAESDYYESLAVPYPAANAPIRHIGDLMLIKGITPELYHGSVEAPGLAHYVTAFGYSGKQRADLRFDGKININTAEAPVIAAILPPEYQMLAQAIVDYRQERIDAKEFEVLQQPTWYKSAPGCADLDLPTDLVTVYSDLFRVSVTAVSGARRQRMTACVQCQRQGTPVAKRCMVVGYE